MNSPETNSSHESDQPVNQERLAQLHIALRQFAKHYGKPEDIAEAEIGTSPEDRPQRWTIQLDSDSLKRLDVVDWGIVHIEFEDEHFDPDWSDEQAWWPARLHLYFADPPSSSRSHTEPDGDWLAGIDTSGLQTSAVGYDVSIFDTVDDDGNHTYLSEVMREGAFTSTELKHWELEKLFSPALRAIVQSYQAK